MQRSKEKEMSASLTLNKITAQKGITIAEAANRVADLGWTPSYVQEAMTFPTDYKISKTPRDPMKQVRSEEHTSELQSHLNLVCRLLLEKKKKQRTTTRKEYN